MRMTCFSRTVRCGIVLLLLVVGLLQGCAKFINVVTSEPIQINPRERTLGTRIDDTNIETITRVNLKKASSAFDDAHVNIDCFNGILLLTGQVPTAQMQQLAGDVAAQLNNIKQVHNEIVVAPNPGLQTRSHDTWLTGKIKSKLALDSNIQGGRIHLISESGSVFLMGIVSRHEAERITDIVRNTGGVRQVVKVFEYVD